MSRREESSPTEVKRPSWKIDEPFCKLTFDNQSYSLRLEADITEEPYQSHTPAREFVPLTITSGMRTRVLVRFSISLPDLPMRKGRKPQRIGEGQAWFYQEDHLLLLWRCNLLGRYKAANPAEDQNLHVLWKGFEQFLLRQFPNAVQIVTPGWNRPYDESLWFQFIQMHKFTHPSPTGIPRAAFIKGVETRL